MAHPQSSDNSWSIAFCRIAGYGLLAVALINLVDTFVPSYFTNPNWEFGTVGLITERMPLALVGLVLVFFGGVRFRNELEKPLLMILSWATLLAGILFLLLIPLAAGAGLRINNQNVAQLSAQYTHEMAQLNQIQAQIADASDQELSQLMNTLGNQTPELDAASSQDLKNQLAEEVERAKRVALSNRRRTQQSQRLNLLKSVTKWSLTSLVSAFLFFSIWRMTRWARRPRQWRSLGNSVEATEAIPSKPYEQE